MRCPTPITIRNPNAKDEHDKNSTIQVPCGRCGACRHNRRTEWAFRLKVEHRYAQSAFFITLTYDDSTLPTTKHGEVTLVKKHIQDYIKRTRKQNAQIWDHQLRYYAVGEYGTKTNRPHYHVILFNLHPKLVDQVLARWKKGHVHVGAVNDSSIFYACKFHVTVRKDEYLEDERQPEFATMSRRPAIGWQYLYDSYELDGRKVIYKGDKNTSWHRDNFHTFVMNNGFRQKLPRYYKTKIWNNDEAKTITKINQIATEKSNRKEIARIHSKGFADPDKEIFRRHLEVAKKVKHKSTDRDTF